MGFLFLFLSADLGALCVQKTLSCNPLCDPVTSVVKPAFQLRFTTYESSISDSCRAARIAWCNRDFTVPNGRSRAAAISG